MILTVKNKSLSGFNLWDCVDEKGRRHSVDLHVDATYEGDIKEGDIFDVEELCPITVYAWNVKRKESE